jgi:sugar/nucleoside kinase (ribokinase family)
MAKLDVSIAGEINLDLILYGLPQQMPTERELLGTGFTMTLGSSSAILAHNLAVLGSSVGFVTKLGQDAMGRIALERLAESGADVSHVVYASGTGSGVTLILPHDNERHILTYAGTIFELAFEDLDLGYLSSARHFHLSSFFLHRALADRIPELFRYMKGKGLSTSLDTNDDPDDLWAASLRETLKYVDVILPNEREAKKIAATDDLEQAIVWLSDRVPSVVIKLGARGAMAVSGGERYTAAPSPVRVVDTVGAGDSFDAGFLYQYVKGADIQGCLDFGNLTGAFSTTAPGGTEAFRNRNAVRDFLQNNLIPQAH